VEHRWESRQDDTPSCEGQVPLLGTEGACISALDAEECSIPVRDVEASLNGSACDFYEAVDSLSCVGISWVPEE
jgi:hypothetical protein